VSGVNGGSGIVIVRYVIPNSLPAVGGTMTTPGSHIVFTFTHDGILVVSAEALTCDVLVVAGGGGGAGGVLYLSGVSLTAGTYGVTVGAGGAVSGDGGHSATNNTGGGGGSDRYATGGNGGSGIVIIRYAGPPRGSTIILN
jgi:hypothetical protein